MIPYYILNIEKFNMHIKEFEVPCQLTIVGVKDRPPTIRYAVKDNQILKEYIKYDLTCEIAHNQKGRAYNTERIFQGFILIKEKIFYYSKHENIIIMSAPKDVFLNFVKIFSDDKKMYPLKIKKIDVDFLYIINNQYSKGIQGVWLGDYPDTNIDSLYLIGRKIENSEQYHMLLEKGATIRNLTILYNFNGKTEKIMVTKEGGIVLYKDVAETDALTLIEDIYKKLFVKME